MHTSFLYTSVFKFSPDKADPTYGSDVLMLDLEDSVHTREKQKARELLTSFDLRPLVANHKAFGVRVNNINTIDGIKDICTVFDCMRHGLLPIEYLQIPKVRSHYDVIRCRAYLQEVSTPELKIFPIVETPEGITNVERIASVSDLLLFGLADITATMYRPNVAYLAQARGRFVVACAQSRICSVDTRLFEEIADMSIYKQACLDAKAEGFLAKAVIHPNQVSVAKTVFATSVEELEHYRAVIAAYQKADTGFQLVDGSVIAPPFVEKAKLMLDVYKKYNLSFTQDITPPSIGRAMPVMNEDSSEHNQ